MRFILAVGASVTNQFRYGPVRSAPSLSGGFESLLYDRVRPVGNKKSPEPQTRGINIDAHFRVAVAIPDRASAGWLF